LILWFLVSDLKERIRPPDYGRRYVDAKNNRAKDTNKWIFENEDFKTWSGGNSTLLLTGECKFSDFSVVQSVYILCSWDRENYLVVRKM
jgi:hypothetical protein